ncbi:hypothetical protein BLOT_015612 [Blomia tropicalis]|nr:hypothetical protein BLOT_015612 [Blomia tropicalis]
MNTVSNNNNNFNNNSNNSNNGNKNSANKDSNQLFCRSEIVPKANVKILSEMLEISDIDEGLEDLNLKDDDKRKNSNSNGLISTREIDKIITISRPIDLTTAKKLKTLLLGAATNSIGPEWRNQYFIFETKVPELWYGLVQTKGGPCGLLATLQGYFCAEIFHLNKADVAEKDVNLSSYCYRCLSHAIGMMLWQIGGHRRKVIVAFELDQMNENTKRPIPFPDNGEIVADGITERIWLAEFEDQVEMIEFIIKLFMIDRTSIGCISLAYSCILTRGIDQIKLDYDCGSIESLLTPERLLCTQELVNLTLIGRAVSNVFDRHFALTNEMILQGITRQSLIGFLTIHEHEGAFKVGSCYKNPKLPIYVVLNEYHFTLLFSKHKSNDLETKPNPINGLTCFDLYYYDGLLGQDQEICLTIDVDNSNNSCEDNSSNSSPIEFVIRTKWPNASIDWNGSEKLF